MRTPKLFKKLYSIPHLEEHFNEIQYKCSTGMDKISPKHFIINKNLYFEIINRKVLNGTYHFTNYKQTLISKGANKSPREISIPTVRDKLTLSILYEVLDKSYDDQTLHTPLPQLVIDDISKAISQNSHDYFIKIDISKFYSSVNHKILLKKIRKRIRKKERSARGFANIKFSCIFIFARVR